MIPLLAGAMLLGEAGYTPPAKLSILGGGQSLEEYYKRGNPAVSTIFCEAVADEMGYSAGSFVQYTAGGGAIVTNDAGSKAGTGYTVRYINGASGGSALVGRNSNASGGNYWWNFEDNSAITGDPSDTAGTPGPLLKALYGYIDTYGEIDCFQWSQGESDVSYTNTGSTERQNYKDTLQTLFEEVRTYIGDDELPIFIKQIGRGNRAASLQNIKDIQRELSISMTNVFIVAQQYYADYAIAANFTGGTTSGSPIVTYAGASDGNSGVNMNIQGPGIPDQSYIISKIDGVSFTLNQNATATNASASLNRMDDTHPYPGDLSDQPLDSNGNTTHDTDKGFYNIARRSAVGIADWFLNQTTSRAFGPKVVNISAPIGGTEVFLAIEHYLGTTLTTPSGAISSASSIFFRVENNGVAKTISNVELLTDETIKLTLSTSVSSGTMDVYCGYSAMNRTDRTKFIIDNATVPMPLQQGSPISEPDIYAIIPGDAIPINTLAPVILGAGITDATLYVTDGTWTGSASFTYAYQWQVNGVDVPGATSNSFSTTGLSNGDEIDCVVSATNSEGTTPATTPNTVTLAARNASIASVHASAVFDLDATIGTSANGVEGQWRNLVIAPADSSAREDYDFFKGAALAASTDDPTFTGTVDDAAAYWLLDGGDYFVKAASNTAFLRDLHKSTGASPATIAIAMKFVNSGSIQALLGTASGNPDHGLYIGLGTTNRLQINQVRGAATSTTTVASGYALADADEALMVITFDYTGTAVKFFVRSKTKDPATLTLSKSTDTTDASYDARIGARGASSSKPANGTRLYGIYGFNSILSDSDVGALFDLIEARHARDYTP